MLLLTIVAAYVLTIVGTFVLCVRSFLRRETPATRRILLSVAALAELLYMLGSPACIYLPRAPGKPAVQRTILGRDDSGVLYLLEGTSHLSLACGPRWWFGITHSGPDFGAEIVPPLRYARLKHAAWQIVFSRGNRRPLQTHDFGVVRSDGTIVDWWINKGIYLLSPTASEWRPVAPLPNKEPFLYTISALDGGHTLEVYANSATFDESKGHILDLLLRERDELGRVVNETKQAIGPSETAHGPVIRLEAAFGGGRVFLLNTWIPHSKDPGALGSNGKGAIYALSRDLSAVESLGVIDVDADGVVMDFAVSGDGRFFTTGQAIFSMRGEKFQDLVPPLASPLWVGDTLYGVAKYPFFIANELDRADAFNSAFTFTPHRIRSPASEPAYMRGRQSSRWVLGGLDEAGREDQVVQVAVR